MGSLELRHVCVYLPYGVNFKYDRPGGITDTITSLYDIDEDDTIKLKIGYSDAEHIWMFKPILKKLEDLTKSELKQIIGHIFRDSKMPNPKMESIKCEKGFITFYDNDTSQTYVAVKPGKDGFPVMNMSNTFDDYSVFFGLHVDMFGLIEKGLAIDINTIQS